jgi:nucleotide-binding universal stress UspA family protein
MVDERKMFDGEIIPVWRDFSADLIIVGVSNGD